MQKIISTCLIALALFLAAVDVNCFAEGEQIDLNALTQELVKRSDRPGDATVVYWFPQEYWQESLAQNPNVTAAQIEEQVKVFRPYTVVAVVDGTISAYGSIAYKNEAEIRSNLVIVDSQGNTYSPLAEAGVNADTKAILAIMKPAWANALGPLGQNMYFFVFSAQNKDGQDVVSPKKEGAFLVKLGEREFKWKLPLSTLLPAKVCPTCKEKISGVYRFCPWDGTKLE